MPPPAPECYLHPGRETYISCQRCERPICPDCMRSASVGFQCPACVRDGARTTRTGRTAYGGARVSNPGLTSGILIGLNTAVFVLITLTGGAASRLVDWLLLRPDGLCTDGGGRYADTTAAVCAGQGIWLPGVADGAWWQLLTSVFTHVQPMHIGFNMLALWVLGPQLEQVLGRGRFLALYLLSGLAGSVLVYWAASPWSSTLGASGAVFGLMGALLVVALKTRGDVRGILFWIGLNAAITLVGAGSISWQGHLGGFLGGLALMALFAWAPRGSRRTSWQVAGAVVFALLLLALVAARTLMLR